MTRIATWWVWLTLSVGVVIADQCTKLLVINQLEMGQRIALLPGLTLTYVVNHGAAFSFLNSMGGWQRWLFSGLAVFISVLLIQWLRHLPPTERLIAFAIALILGGAVGNLIDRMVYGYVIDFILVYYRSWSWPVFNLADSAITVGATILGGVLIFCKQKRGWFF
jgi:signal peptidase II